MRVNVNDEQANLAFVRSQATHVEAGVYKTKYAAIQYPELIPVDTSANEFAPSVTYASMDGRGAASWINGNAMDIPTVRVAVNQSTTFVETAGIGYEYGWQEVGYARLLGINLPSEQAELARRISEEFIDNVALNGDTTKNFKGLINNSAITPANVALNAGASSRLWSAKTPLEVAADINEALNDIWSDSYQIEMADTVLMSPERLGFLATTPMSADNNMTLLNYIKANNLVTTMGGGQIMFRGVRGLSTAGASGTQRMVAYRRAPDVLKMHLPMPHRFFPVQVTGLRYMIPGAFRFGGVDIRLPGAVRYRDGF